MLELKNSTPFAANYVLLPNAQGVDTLYVNVKASFNLGANWTLCDEQIEPLYEDAYWGEPGKSSIKFPTSVHQGKPGTDIAVIGSACAPNNKPVRQLDVSATIGANKKTLRVYGERFWEKGRITHAKEFIQMPIRYENAFGGQHWENDELISLEPRNPLGKGYRGTRDPEEMEGRPLPNIENPMELIQHIDDTPEPAGFGFIAPNWYPRASYAGTYDEQWQQNRAPYLPMDYQPRFQNSAHADLVSENPLVGGEAVALTNLHPMGPIHFVLPQVALEGRALFNRQAPLNFLMETLTIDVDTGQLTMDWKASCLCNNMFPQLRAINIHLLR